MARKVMTIEERLIKQVTRFWQNAIRKHDPDACWGWRGGTSNGYGRAHLGHGETMNAHVVSYCIAHGILPEQLPDDPTNPGCHMAVLHNCDQRSCTNPRHLRLGTLAENTAEAKRTGVFRKPKLRREQVEDVIQWRLAGDPRESPTAFANRVAQFYGVRPLAIYVLLAGSTWPNVRPEVPRPVRPSR